MMAAAAAASGQRLEQSDGTPPVPVRVSAWSRHRDGTLNRHVGLSVDDEKGEAEGEEAGEVRLACTDELDRETERGDNGKTQSLTVVLQTNSPPLAKRDLLLPVLQPACPCINKYSSDTSKHDKGTSRLGLVAAASKAKCSRCQSDMILQLDGATLNSSSEEESDGDEDSSEVRGSRSLCIVLEVLLATV